MAYTRDPALLCLGCRRERYLAACQAFLRCQGFLVLEGFLALAALAAFLVQGFPSSRLFQGFQGLQGLQVWQAALLGRSFQAACQDWVALEACQVSEVCLALAGPRQAACLVLALVACLALVSWAACLALEGQCQAA